MTFGAWAPLTRRILGCALATALGVSGAHADWVKDLERQAAKRIQTLDAQKEAQKASAALKAAAARLPQTPAVQAAVAQVTQKLEPTRGGFVADLQSKIELLQLALASAPDYRAKLATLRALRARPAPIATGYDPARALSAAGQQELYAKAETYEKLTEARHVHFGVLYKQATLDPQTRGLLAAAALGDSSYHNGQYLAARAYKYGVTGAAADLERLQNSLLGAYNQMTLAGAPSGRILDPRTGRVVAPRAGLPIRGFADDTSPLFRDNGDLDPRRPETYVYEGTLAGLPGKRFRFMADVSRDQVAGLMLGFQAAHEVLTRRNAAPQWRARIAEVVGAFARAFLRDGYRIIDLTGRPTTHGDGSNLKDPVTLLFDLNWLKVAAEVTGAADLRKAYDALVLSQLGAGGWKGVALSAALDLTVTPILREHPEAVRYVASDFNYNLLALTLHPLLRLERNLVVRGIVQNFLTAVAWPLWSDLRVPFFDGIYLMGTGQKDPALVARMAGVLGQYRRELTPFANPAHPTELVTDFSQRAELRDPLFAYLSDLFERDLKNRIKGAKDNPIKSGGGIWPLGPGLVPADNNIERATPYRLRGTGARCGAGICSYAGHDYLLSYWFARYHGLL